MTQNQFESVYGEGSLGVLATLISNKNEEKGYCNLYDKQIKKLARYQYSIPALSNIYKRFEKANLIYRLTEQMETGVIARRVRKIYINQLPEDITKLINEYISGYPVTALFGTTKEFYQSSGIEQTKNEIKIRELEDEILKLRNQIRLNQEQLTLKICLLEFFKKHDIDVFDQDVEGLVGQIMEWHYKVMEVK